MPSIGQAFAALIAQAASVEVEATEQYAVFPSFFFPVVPDAIATDGRPAAFDFMHRINMIPDHPPVFALSADFVWAAYRQVLSDKRLAPSSDGQHSYAKRFAAAVAQLGDGQMTITEDNYFTTSVTPTDIASDTAWTPVALGRDGIAGLADALPERERRWLQRFNTLSVLGEELIESISFERLVLVILRPWYDPSIFGLRFWDLDGPPISDGGDPPRGRMPGVASKLVLLRNLRLKLAATRLPDIGPTIVYRRLDGAAEPPAPLHAAQLIQLSAAEAEPMMLAKPLRADAGPVALQIKARAAEALAETGAPAEAPSAEGAAPPITAGGAQKFHVPFSFDTSAARALAQVELDAANATLAARQNERTSLQSRLDAMMAEFAKLEKAGVGGIFRAALPTKLLTAAKRLELTAIQQAVPIAEEALAAAQQEQQRCQRVIQLLDQIDAIKADATAYVLALVCDRVLKAPNPDPALFPQP